MRPHSFVNDRQSSCQQPSQQTSPPNLKHYSNLRVNENRWSRPSSSTPTNTPLYSPTGYAPNNANNIDQQYCKVISEYKSGLSSNFTRGNFLSQSLMVSSSGASMAARKPPLPPQMTGGHTVNNSPHLSRIMGSSYYVSPPPCGWKTVGNVVTVKRSTSVTGSLRQSDSQDRFVGNVDAGQQKKNVTTQLHHNAAGSGRKWTAPFHCLLKKDGSSHNSRMVSANNDGVVAQHTRKERKQRTAVSPAEKIASTRTSLFKKKSHQANQDTNPVHYTHSSNHHHGSMSRGIKKSISLLFSPRSTRNSKSDLSTPINSEKPIKSSSKHGNTASTISISAACKHPHSKQHKSSEEILMISSKSCDDDDYDDDYRTNYGNNSILGSVTPSVSLRSSVSQPMGGWAMNNVGSGAGGSLYEKERGIYDDDDDDCSEDDEDDGRGTCVDMSRNYGYMSVSELEQVYQQQHQKSHHHPHQVYHNMQRSRQSSQYDLAHADMVSSYHSTYSTNSSLITSKTPILMSNNNNKYNNSDNNNNNRNHNNNSNITCCVPGNIKRFPNNNTQQTGSFHCQTPTLLHPSQTPSYAQSITPTSSGPTNLPIPPPHLSIHTRHPHPQSRPFITHYHHHTNIQDNNCTTPTQQHPHQPPPHNNWKTIVGNVCRSNSKDSAIANSSVSTEMGILGQSQRASLISSGGTSEDFHNDQDSSYSSLSDVRSSNSFHHYYHHHSRTSNNQLPPVTDEKSSSSSSPPTTAVSDQQGSTKSNEISPSTSSDISTGTLRPIGRKQTHLSRSCPALNHILSPRHSISYKKRIRSYSNLHRDIKPTKVVPLPQSVNQRKTQKSQYTRLQTIPTDIESLITTDKFVSMKSSGLTNSPLLSQYSRLYSLRSTTSNHPAISPTTDLKWNSTSISHNNKSGKLNSPTASIDLSNSPLKKLHQVIYDNNQIQATHRKIHDFSK